jgi:hypothetical protein
MEMKTRNWHAARTGLVASLLACTLTGWAMQSGKTAQGWPYTAGGVSLEERAALIAQGKGHSLWVVTAAMKSGSFLSNVRVVIRDAKQNVVFDNRIDGPWLFIDLPLGRYEVEAAFNGATQKKVTTIHPGDHHQALFYFESNNP